MLCRHRRGEHRPSDSKWQWQTMVISGRNKFPKGSSFQRVHMFLLLDNKKWRIASGLWWRRPAIFCLWLGKYQHGVPPSLPGTCPRVFMWPSTCHLYSSTSKLASTLLAQGCKSREKILNILIGLEELKKSWEINLILTKSLLGADKLPFKHRAPTPLS